MNFRKKKSGKLVQILSLIIGSFSISIAGIALVRANKNAKILNKISKELNLENRLISINSDRWIRERMAMRPAVREVKLPRAKKRFLTG